MNETSQQSLETISSPSLTDFLIVIRITLSLSIIRQNQEGGDTAQITDFAQTCYKCWI